MLTPVLCRETCLCPKLRSLIVSVEGHKKKSLVPFSFLKELPLSNISYVDLKHVRCWFSIFALGLVTRQCLQKRFMVKIDGLRRRPSSALKFFLSSTVYRRGAIFLHGNVVVEETQRQFFHFYHDLKPRFYLFEKGKTTVQ